MNDQERLELAIRFAQMDLSTLRRGDWLNLNDDLFTFISPGPTFKKVGEVLTKENRTDLQKEILHILSELIRLRDEGEFSFESVDVSITARPIQIGFAITGTQFRKGVYIVPIGETRDLILARLFTLFELEGVEKILRCAAPDCNRIFYKKRKQRYCSPRCQTREFMKTWRKENKEKESEQNHKKYKKRVEKSRGRPTKIARRSRTKRRAG